MNEPVTAATDVLLLLQCGYLAYRLSNLRGAERTSRRAAVALFVMLALGALLGAIVHAAQPSELLIVALAWRASLVSLCCAGGAALLSSVQLLRRDSTSVRGGGAVVTAVAALAGVVWPDFRVAAIALGSGSVALGAACTLAASARGPSPLRLAAAGLAVCAASVAVQQLGWGFYTAWFDHNALFHLGAMLGLALLYLGLRSALSEHTKGGFPC